jgi:hypothetical protein
MEPPMSTPDQPSSRWRSRILRRDDGGLDIREMKAGDLQLHPNNPKRHPERQRVALQEQLAEAGKTRILTAYYSPALGGALTLTDGHSRVGLDPDEMWAVAVLDLSDEEAAQDIALGDEIGALFERDRGKLENLLGQVKASGSRLQALLGEVAGKAGIVPGLRIEMPATSPFHSPVWGPAPDVAQGDENHDDGEGETVPSAALAPGTAYGGLPPSHVRMVQLFLNTDTQPVFLDAVRLLQAHFETDNITDTVARAVDYAKNTLNLGDA